MLTIFPEKVCYIIVKARDEDEQIDLMTRAWNGREDFGPEEWKAARAEAAAVGNKRAPGYLLGMPPARRLPGRGAGRARAFLRGRRPGASLKRRP